MPSRGVVFNLCTFTRYTHKKIDRKKEVDYDIISNNRDSTVFWFLWRLRTDYRSINQRCSFGEKEMRTLQIIGVGVVFAVVAGQTVKRLLKETKEWKSRN